MDSILNDVIDAINDPIYIMDKNRDFIFANSQLVKLTGYTRRELLSFNGLELERTGTIGRAFSSEVIETKDNVTIVQKIVKKNNEIDEFLITLNPVFDGKGEIKYLVGVIKDVKQINHDYSISANDETLPFIKYRTHKPCPNIEKHIVAVAESSEMKSLISKVKSLSLYDTSMLILGETGTGKEVFANLIHEKSHRRDQDMIKINCASLPATLLEAELFGYEPGAFTGAGKNGKKGLIELAHRGTLFLDEIDSLPLALQGKFLRALDNKRIRRIGSGKEIFVDFRLITATNANLRQLVKDKKFREDLFYRINIVPIVLPPLRERIADIEPLCKYFLKMYSDKYNKQKVFAPNIFRALEKYPWPGNVRELKNFVEMMVVTSSYSDTIIENIPANHFNETKLDIAPATSEELDAVQASINLQTQSNNVDFDFEAKDFDEIMSEFEKIVLQTAISKYHSTCEVAKQLKVNQSTIYRKRQKHQL